MQTFKPGEHTKEQWDTLIEIAGEIGERHGTDAGEGVEMNNAAIAEWWLTGMEDGDPKVMDALPSATLSGEQAGEYTVASLYRDLGVTSEHDSDDLALCDAYDNAFNGAVQAEVGRRARAMLET